MKIFKNILAIEDEMKSDLLTEQNNDLIKLILYKSIHGSIPI